MHIHLVLIKKKKKIIFNSNIFFSQRKPMKGTLFTKLGFNRTTIHTVKTNHCVLLCYCQQLFCYCQQWMYFYNIEKHIISIIITLYCHSCNKIFVECCVYRFENRCWHQGIWKKKILFFNLLNFNRVCIYNLMFLFYLYIFINK